MYACMANKCLVTRKIGGKCIINLLNILANEFTANVEHVQWNLYKADTIGAKKCVRSIEMSAL